MLQGLDHWTKNQSHDLTLNQKELTTQANDDSARVDWELDS